MNKRSNNSPEEPKDLTWGEIFSRWGGVLRKRKVLVESRAAQGYPEVDSDSIRSATGEIRRLTRFLALSAGTIAITVAGLVGPMIYFSVRGEQPGAAAPAAGADAGGGPMPAVPTAARNIEEDRAELLKSHGVADNVIKEVGKGIVTANKALTIANGRLLYAYTETILDIKEFSVSYPDLAPLLDRFRHHAKFAFNQEVSAEDAKKEGGLDKFMDDKTEIFATKDTPRLESPEEFLMSDYPNSSTGKRGWFKTHEIAYFDPKTRTFYPPAAGSVKDFAPSRASTVLALNDMQNSFVMGGPDYKDPKIMSLMDRKFSPTTNTIADTVGAGPGGAYEAILNSINPSMSPLVILKEIMVYMQVQDIKGEKYFAHTEAVIYTMLRLMLASGDERAKAVEAQLTRIVENPQLININAIWFGKINEADNIGALFAAAGWEGEEVKRIDKHTNKNAAYKRYFFDSGTEAQTLMAEIKLEELARKNPGVFKDAIKFFREKGRIVFMGGAVENYESDIGFEYPTEKGAIPEYFELISADSLEAKEYEDKEAKAEAPKIDWLLKRNLAAFGKKLNWLFVNDNRENEKDDNQYIKASSLLIAIDDARRVKSGKSDLEKGHLEEQFKALSWDFYTPIAEDIMAAGGEDFLARMKTVIESPRQKRRMKGNGHESLMKSRADKEGLAYIMVRVALQSSDARMAKFKPGLKYLVEHPEMIKF